MCLISLWTPVLADVYIYREEGRVAEVLVHECLERSWRSSWSIINRKREGKTAQKTKELLAGVWRETV